VKRFATALLLAAILPACGGGTAKPRAFPGSALDKANEYVRQIDALGLRHGDAKRTAEIYGTVGDGFCAYKSAAERREEEARTAKAQPHLDPRPGRLVVKIYCPWLL
jgi:hypothetical protein